jgi:serine/threonine protein kinase
LQKIKEKHANIQTGRFREEFMQVHTDKNVSGRKTTQIIFSMHIRDGQIYAIKKVKLNSFPSWERIYNNQVQEIREIRAMLRLSHKNVLRLFSWWFEEELEDVIKNDIKRTKKNIYLYLQTEYLAYKDQSSDLLEFIYVNFEYMKVFSNFMKLPTLQRRSKIFNIFNQVLDGIQYVHE